MFGLPPGSHLNLDSFGSQALAGSEVDSPNVTPTRDLTIVGQLHVGFAVVLVALKPSAISKAVMTSAPQNLCQCSTSAP